MCGIFGAFGWPGSFNMDTLKSATATMYHRGPDGRQHWMSDDQKVGLGHTRLSIIDIAGGAQPIQNEDGSIHAVVNGELYDFERIRSELKAKGHSFSSASDSEILIHLYEELGTDFLHELRGEFAFVLFDSKTQRLIAGRDRFGIKPLYYTKHYGTLYFASEIKALLAAGVDAKWDEESLYISWHLGIIQMQDRTFFKGVYQVPPGYIVIADEHTHRLHQYWDFNYPLLEDHQYKFSDEEYIEMFRNHFEEAVKLRLRADVPVGVYLSGGIDSCSILGTIAKLQGSKVKAFSIAFDEEAYNEALIAKEMAEFTGAEFNSYQMTSETIAKHFVESVKYSEILCVNTNCVAKFILSKHVRDSGYKVVLTGEGSDEILGGYAHFRQDLLLYANEYKDHQDRMNFLNALANENEASRGLLMADGVADDNNSIKRRLGFVPSWLEQCKSQVPNIKRFLNNESISKFNGYDAYGVFLDGLDVRNKIQGRHVLNQSLYIWSKHSLPNYLLSNLGDRMEMGHSVEGRVPFLDHKLVEFAAAMPVSLKIRNMKEKYILREALRPVITKTVYEKQKHPFLAPPSTRINKDPLSMFIHEYIGDHLNKLPFLDRKMVEGLLKNVHNLEARERKIVDPTIITIASIIALQEQFGLKA